MVNLADLSTQSGDCTGSHRHNPSDGGSLVWPDNSCGSTRCVLGMDQPPIYFHGRYTARSIRHVNYDPSDLGMEHTSAGSYTCPFFQESSSEAIK